MYERKKIEECEKELRTSFSKGLSRSEAKERLLKNGKNELDEGKKKSIITLFFEQLNDPMIYILLMAIVISLVLEKPWQLGWTMESISEAIIIGIVVLLNGIIGTFQEAKAEKALEALKKMSSSTCIVKRDGEFIEINTSELVVGDVVEIEVGKTIPADLRIIESNNLKIEEASLTGESIAIDKDAKVIFDKEVSLGDRVNMAYMSTNVVGGRGVGVVVSSGMNTQVGKIANLIKNEKDDMTPLQKKLADLGKLLGALAIVLCVIMLIVALIRGNDVVDMLMTAISLAVAAIPEGLPAVVTIVLALGVQRMVKVNTVVRKLPSVETLGAVSVVCSDKTGTLTQNKMTVTKVWAENKMVEVSDAKKYSLLIEGLVLCTDVIISENGLIGEPTEIALIEMGNKLECDKKELTRIYPRINEIPFDSQRKMMTTQHSYYTKKRIYTKGAIDNLLKISSYIYDNGKVRILTPNDKKEIIKQATVMAENALRVIALGYKDCENLEEKDLVFVGFVGMIDPPRKEAKEAVATFKEAGISTVMITGDHKETAFAIAKDLGIANTVEECINGDEIDCLTQEELNKKTKKIKVYSRVSPQHKVRIVKAFKANDKIVAMTGDGVNDAPSLKAADIGIAMGMSGTDVAKGAADMVLSDDNFASIEKAIEEGRTIYANIKKSVLFLLSSNFAEVITMFFAVILGFPIPLIAIHILWVNLLTDSIPALALGSDNKETDVMKEQPRNPKDSLFSHGGMKFTLFYGFLIALLTLIAFISIPCAELNSIGMDINYSSIKNILLSDAYVLMKAQTFAFTTLAISELLHALGMRNIKKSFIRKDILNNKLMIIAILIGAILQIAVIEIPMLNDFFGTANLQILEWCFIFGLSFMTLLVHELLVFFINCKNRRQK